MTKAPRFSRWPQSFKPDPYILALIAMVVLASLAPIRGPPARDFSLLTKLAIALLFFLHGARLSRAAVVAGVTQWRLHLVVLATTFGLFPLLGLAIRALPGQILPGSLAAGVLFLCLLPSTVQSSIAFTSIARGNVAAAVCAASLSNLLGVFITPVLAAVTLNAHGAGATPGQAGAVALQILLPFAAGQIARPALAPWIGRHGRLVGMVDRGSILMVVYGAFSAAVAGGLWRRISADQILNLTLVCAALLGVVLTATVVTARTIGFAKADEIALVFCGSKKSLASGAPMASILFAPASVGLMVLPLMIFHQLQLIACALIAQRYAARVEDAAPTPLCRSRVNRD